MQFFKNSVTFYEISYDVNELHEWYQQFIPFTKILACPCGAGSQTDILDVEALEGKKPHEYEIVQRLAKPFKLLLNFDKEGDNPVRIFNHNPGEGIPPHIDEVAECALIFPIVPVDISPVFYLKQGDKPYKLGKWWNYNEFTLDDIDYFHQYSFGHPSLINGRALHGVTNTHPTSPRAILRFKISHINYEQCIELIKSGEFLN